MKWGDDDYYYYIQFTGELSTERHICMHIDRVWLIFVLLFVIELYSQKMTIYMY